MRAARRNTGVGALPRELRSRPAGTEGLYGIPGLPWPEAYKGVCEPLTTMAAAAAVTERVRIGSSVLMPALHHPVQLAVALATIDQIGGGRVVAGIGSGWAHSDFAAVGVPFSERNRLLGRQEISPAVLSRC